MCVIDDPHNANHWAKYRRLYIERRFVDGITMFVQVKSTCFLVKPQFVCVCDIKLKHNFVRHINLHPLFIGAFSGTCKISKTCWNLISSTKCWLVQSTIEHLYISSIWPKMSCNVLVQQCRNVYPYKLMVGIPSLYGQVGDGGSYITTLILGVIWQCVKTLYPWWTSK